MIVFDGWSLVGAAVARDNVQERALVHALRTDQVALSQPVLVELLDMLERPRLKRFLVQSLVAEVLGQLYAFGVILSPTLRITDCRDAKDNKYLELALVAKTDTIVSCDDDLLVLHPWRGVRIMRPDIYLSTAVATSA